MGGCHSRAERQLMQKAKPCAVSAADAAGSEPTEDAAAAERCRTMGLH